MSPDDVNVLWSRWRQGENSVQISAVLGCNKDTVIWHIARTGGLRPRERQRAARHLQPAEREDISRGLARGETIRAMARRLGRAPSTISRELARQGGPAAYRATAADAAAWASARRPKRCRLGTNRRLRRVVERKLRREWSPQQIAAWLARRYPDDRTMHVSHETIYQALYVQARGALKRALVAHLRQGQRYRRPRAAARATRGPGQLVDTVSIAERPPSGRRAPTRARCRATGKATC